MNAFLTILKLNLKLLLRNKGYLCFLVILPIVSILLLNLPKSNSYAMNHESNYDIHELGEGEQTPLNMSSTRLCVAVLDSSQNEISEYLLKKLALSGSYEVYRYRVSEMSLAESEEKAKELVSSNNISTVLYFGTDFKSEVLTGDSADSLHLYETAYDTRITQLRKSIDGILLTLYQFANASGGKEDSFLDILQESLTAIPQKFIQTIDSSDELVLTSKQEAASSNLGYSLAIVTIAFLFSGVFIASNIIEERNDKVTTRIHVSGVSPFIYEAVQVVLSFVTVTLQILVMTIGIKLFVKTDFGITLFQYVFLIFLLGMFFNLLSIVTGILTNNMLDSIYTAFFVWCISAMLSGLYFSLDTAGKTWQNIAMLMPQRWTITASKMLMVGKSGVYSWYSLAIGGFILLIIATGFIGIRVTNKSQN